MKKLLVILIGSCLISCATFKSYDQNQFTNKNYQQNIDNLIASTDSLMDFTDSDNTDSKIDINGATLLIQADLYFNQSNYINALPIYEQLAYQYKIPKIIYKAILCYERTGYIQNRTQNVDKLVSLFIQVAPNTDIAKLLQIRLALYNGDIKLAKNNINNLLQSKPEQARNYLLFLSSNIMVSFTKTFNNANLDEFANYVLDKYSQYPEGYLFAATLFATTDNVLKLDAVLHLIRSRFPNWQIPLFWSVNILANQHNYNSIIDITYPYVKDNINPDWSIQNIYVGTLINNNQTNLALNYLNSQQKIGDNANVQLNLGIIYAISKNYATTIEHLSNAKFANSTMNNMINLLIALTYDSQQQHTNAIIYYSRVSGNVYMENIANTLMVNDYYRLHNKTKVDELVNQMIKDKNVSGLNELLLKVQIYLNLEDYNSAYNLLQKNYATYKQEPDFIYVYASSCALSRRTQAAIKAYNYYIKLVPSSEYGYNDLAYVYAEQTNNYKLALKYAKQAAAINITNANVLDTLGFAYYKLGDYVNAYPLINSSYQANKNKEAAKHLKAVLTKLKQPALADSIFIMDNDSLNLELSKMLADRMLNLLMLLQYGSVNIR